jgi:hypothetical protein
VLAYVFWHWRRPDVDAASYARLVTAFHEALERHPPEGFLRSAFFHGGSVAWLGAADSYEDWYLTEGSRALDPLDAGAVSGPCRTAHDAAARAALGGTAGLYRLRLGSGNVTQAGWTTWFSKPAQLPYAKFYEVLQPLCTRDGVDLWGRQMTLGPTAEFCLMGSQPMGLPAGLSGTSRPLERLWPRFPSLKTEDPPGGAQGVS